MGAQPNFQSGLLLKLSMFPQNLKKWTLFPFMHESNVCMYVCLLFHKLKLENMTHLQFGGSERK